MAFSASGLTSRANESKLAAAFETGSIRNAVTQLIRVIKGEHVGIDMMDIMVCGAVAPYNALLGGKLVCMLLCSPETVERFAIRYGRHVSIIASAMRGKAVVRKPKLVLLCTTSLYGVGSSQYNRVRVLLEDVGGKGDAKLEYVELGMSKGYGSYHFSRASIA